MMTYITRVAACLGAILLVTACAAPGSVAPGDGTWIGGPPYDFNNPANWSPVGVPTGTATIPVTATPPAPFITFSVGQTNLAALNLQGALGIAVDAGKSLTLTGQGLTVCCTNNGQAVINGTLTGNAIIGDTSARTGYAIQGSGTINGSIVQSGGALTPGGSRDTPALTVNGTYLLHPRAALVISVFPTYTNRLDVAGKVTLDGGMLAIYVDDPTRSYGPFKALTAGGGIAGKFGNAIVVNDPSYKVDVKYNPTDITVTLRK